MQIIVRRSELSGTVKANPSKSFTQRAYAMASLANDVTEILNPSWSDDACCALGIARQIGANASVDNNMVKITPKAQPPGTKWYVGEAGLSFRMFSPIAALSNRPITLSGGGSLGSRDHSFVIETLKLLGASVRGTNMPLEITGPFIPGIYEFDSGQSSQLLSGLLISLPLLKEDSVLKVGNLKSTPYIEMTMSMMRQFGVHIRHRDFSEFMISGNQVYKGINTRIEADWSGVAFILVAGAIAGSITVTDLSLESTQADRAILDVMAQAGCRTEWVDGNLTVYKSNIMGFSFDATDCPDLFPPLVALAAFAEGTSIIAGVHRLRNKESDRLVTLMQEFKKLGVRIEHIDDTMVVEGVTQVNEAIVSGRGDHRIAMALACAALRSSGPVTIQGAECIRKSYGNFYPDLTALGCNITGDNELLIRQDMSTYLKQSLKH